MVHTIQVPLFSKERCSPNFNSPELNVTSKPKKTEREANAVPNSFSRGTTLAKIDLSFGAGPHWVAQLRMPRLVTFLTGLHVQTTHIVPFDIDIDFWRRTTLVR